MAEEADANAVADDGGVEEAPLVERMTRVPLDVVDWLLALRREQFADAASGYQFMHPAGFLEASPEEIAEEWRELMDEGFEAGDWFEKADDVIERWIELVRAQYDAQGFAQF
uniref:Uncharacterized protein n=1 Tax=Oryza brachyantha TaxID=4533 RepID=J3N9J6_ORYBR